MFHIKKLNSKAIRQRQVHIERYKPQLYTGHRYKENLHNIKHNKENSKYAKHTLNACIR